LFRYFEVRCFVFFGNWPPRLSRATRQLFVTLKTSCRPALHLGSAIGKMIGDLGLTERRYRLHTFRHACATELPRKGTSLQGIADYLGHCRDPICTRATGRACRDASLNRSWSLKPQSLFASQCPAVDNSAQAFPGLDSSG
jgi:integrase